MKTTTLTIRLSAADKEMLQTAARSRGLTVTEYLIQLARADAGPDQTAATALDQVKAELADIRREVAELNPMRISQEIQELRQMMEAVEDQTAPPIKRERRPPRVTVSGIYYAPGDSPDCNPSCVWYDRKSLTCTHPLQQDVDEFPADCPEYTPYQRDK